MPRAVTEEVDERARADQVERAAYQRGQDQRDDRVVGARAHVHADGDVGGREEQRRDIAADHRAPVERAQEGDRDGQRQGERQRQRDQRERAQELAEDEPQRPYRCGEKGLQRPGAPLFRPRAHRECRDEEDQQNRHPLEQRLHVGDVAGEERLHPEHDKQRDREKRGQEEPRRGRAEEAAELLAGNGQDLSHGRPLRSWRTGSQPWTASALASANTVSRSRRSACSAWRLTPARASALATAGAASAGASRR